MHRFPRSSGILLHPSSLPGRFGIGEIGPEAHRWLEELAKMGQRVWQMLPLGPTGYGNSPYQSPSAFAGNPLLISFEALRNDGALQPQDLAMVPAFDANRVEFTPVNEVRMAFLKLAARRFLTQCESSPLMRKAFDLFCDREAAWLDDYALFTALQEEQGFRSWSEWPAEIALRQPEAMANAMVRRAGEVEEHKALQFFFDRQWQALRKKAKQLGILLVGDIPIFAAHDSADVWANPHLFELDEHGRPIVVAGVPPDYFSATGQRWGNPLYKWSAHQAENFAWWKARLRKTFELVDIVRIDHFRGFSQYWEIPASEPTAIHGRWVDAPGDELFDAIQHDMGSAVPVIAEDLGIITPDVTAMRERHGFPGMKVMQFAFGGETITQEYIPENYPEDCVAYTGTHDNDTTLGLFNSGPGGDSTRTQEQVDAERRSITNYTGTDGRELNWDFIERVLASKARFAITPLQDVLGLGSEARMNVPGKVADYWSWRFKWEDLAPHLEERMAAIVRETKR